GAGFASSALCLFLYPQLALWARRMPPASLAISQKSYGQSTSPFVTYRQALLKPENGISQAEIIAWLYVSLNLYHQETPSCRPMKFLNPPPVPRKGLWLRYSPS